MKKYLAFLAVAALLWQSCSDEAASPVLQIGAPPAISSPAGGTSILITEATVGDQFANFTWSAADFGFDAAVSYKVEMDLAGKNFAEAISLGVTNSLELDKVTKGDINNILNAKELPGGEPVNLEFRVVATVSSDVDPVYSSPISLTVTPYTIVVVYPQLQVPGAYQGWSPADNTTVIFSAKSDGKYEGYIYFDEDNTKYKYTQGTTWDTNWGDDGNDGSLQPGGADIPAGLTGVYKLNVNLTELTHTQLRTDWGLIGSAVPGTGWDSDQDMTYDPATNKWYITLDLVAGKIKFRANDDWPVNLGDDGANKTLEYNGADIDVAEAGNYTIELDLSQAKYRYKITKN